MNDFLRSDRLVLRRLTPADVELLWELDSDPEVMRFLSGGAPTPRAVIERELLPRFLRESEGHPGFGYWVAVEEATGESLGWLSLRPAAERDTVSVELGYRLRRSCWGQGFATEGAGLLIRRGFTEWGVQRVMATTYEENRASRRVLEKLGLTLVRAFRLTPADLAGATFYGEAAELFAGEDVEYALTRTDWAASRLVSAVGQEPQQVCAEREERRANQDVKPDEGEAHQLEVTPPIPDLPDAGDDEREPDQ
jgi:RimJ/RimL family protein N-acetyltransferase